MGRRSRGELKLRGVERSWRKGAWNWLCRWWCGYGSSVDRGVVHVGLGLLLGFELEIPEGEVLGGVGGLPMLSSSCDVMAGCAVGMFALTTSRCELAISAAAALRARA